MERRSGGWLKRAARALAREWRGLDDRPLIDIQVRMTTAPVLPRHGPLETDADVLRELARLRGFSGWERLEISRDPLTGAIGGYCVTPRGWGVETASALAMARPPQVVTRLRELLDDSGWRRLEALRGSFQGYTATGGYCERADGSGISFPSRF